MTDNLYYISIIYRKTLHEYGGTSVYYHHIAIDSDNKFYWTPSDDAEQFTLSEIAALAESFDEPNNWIDHESYERGLLYERDLIPVEPFDSRFMS